MADDYEFVDPDTTRIDLGRARWIEVKVELTLDETLTMYGRMRPYVTPGGENQLIAKEVGIARVVAYLVDWSFKDRAGKRIPVTESAIGTLKFPTYQEILAAIDAHVAAEEARRSGEKNAEIGLLNSIAS
jgi:hypothetical protein